MRLNAIIVDVQACVLSYSVLRLCSVCARVSMLRLSLLNSWWNVNVFTERLHLYKDRQAGRGRLSLSWTVCSVSAYRGNRRCVLAEKTPFGISLKNLSLGVGLQQQRPHGQLLWAVNSCVHENQADVSIKRLFAEALEGSLQTLWHEFIQKTVTFVNKSAGNLGGFLIDPKNVWNLICTCTEVVFHSILDCLISLHKNTSPAGTITLQVMSHCINAVCRCVQAQKTVATGCWSH